MTPWLQGLLLGVVQGLTEFLPVSSSGHLVIAQAWLGERFFAASDAVFFDLVLHVGTLLPVLWFYRVALGRIARSVLDVSTLRELGPMGWLRADEDRWLAFLVCVATVPTGLIGVTLEDTFEALFSSLVPVTIALGLTGALLFATRTLKESTDASRLGIGTALLIGLAQGIAITPGISRSGSTIAVALFLGLPRELAARFSFLLSVPAILGAVVLKSRHGIPLDGVDFGAVGTGFFASMGAGYLALTMLVALVKRGGIHRFAYYLWPASLAAFLLLRG
jgi:undecaprenyl-diphosphatase